MLANGAKLEYREKGSETWTELVGLKEIPDLGVEAEKVDNTGLNDKNKQYDNGIGDVGDMKYKFKYKNDSPTAVHRVLRTAAAENKTLEFRETLSDGSMTTYDAQVSVKRTGGGVNGVIETEVTMSVQSDFSYEDPS